MLFSRISYLILAAFILSACQPEIQTAPPLPTINIWQVQYTPATAWLAPISRRALPTSKGSTSWSANTRPWLLDVQAADFSFEWGERTAPPPFAAVIAQDQLAVVVHPSNPITSLTVSEIRDLFSGKRDSWSPLVQSKCPGCAQDFTGPVTAYVYAPAGEMQLAAAWILPGPGAILAPHPAAVAAAIATERLSIGFVPARWLDASIKQVKVEGAEPGMLSRPVLAMAPVEPQGAKRAWLLCLQEKIQ